jgi:hypothetical protein
MTTSCGSIVVALSLSIREIVVANPVQTDGIKLKTLI